MADRPILFSAPMVRALLDGRKTQTRRVLGGRGDVDIFKPGVWSDSYVLDPGNAEWRARYTPFAFGDRLWVKETVRAVELESGTDCFEYQATADDEDDWGDVIPNSQKGSDTWIALRHYDKKRRKVTRRERGGIAGPWVPSIHMPRLVSRLTLTVTNVRVERLQDCSEADAIAEGLKHDIDVDSHDEPTEFWKGADVLPWHRDPVEAYADLWDHINGAGAWEANPWVVAVSFDVRKGNIDG